MRDLSESDGLWKGILRIWYVWQILYLKSSGISFFLLGYVLDILQLIILLTLWKWVNKRFGGIKHNKWIEILPAWIFRKILYANNWKANILHSCNFQKIMYEFYCFSLSFWYVKVGVLFLEDVSPDLKLEKF